MTFTAADFIATADALRVSHVTAGCTCESCHIEKRAVVMLRYAAELIAQPDPVEAFYERVRDRIAPLLTYACDTRAATLQALSFEITAHRMAKAALHAQQASDRQEPS